MPVNYLQNNMSKDDDLYVYGNMAFDGRQNWAISGSDLDLQEILAEGRFARVYRAVLLQAGSSSKTVAAKTLLRESNAYRLLKKTYPYGQTFCFFIPVANPNPNI